MIVQPPTPFSQPSGPDDRVAFDRHELGLILTLYGRMVAAGEWRDYGMSFLRDVAAPPARSARAICGDRHGRTDFEAGGRIARRAAGA